MTAGEEMRDRLRAGPVFFKGHGLGNDYLVFEGREEGEGRGGWLVTPEAVRRVCHRNRGVGGDGLVVDLGRGEGGHRLRMFNPDGGEFERSGNGLRVFAAYLAARGDAPDGQFQVQTGGDTVSMEVLGTDDEGEHDISVSMGRARTGPEAVAADPQVDLRGPDGEALDWQPVSVGNPHCVVFGRGTGSEAVRGLGPHLERHAAFPHGVNVQLVEVPADAEGQPRIRVAVWERGVGITSASGTSACAAAVACVERGEVSTGEVVVEMPGGTLRVGVTPERSVTLRGPVREVCRGTVSPGFLASLASSTG